MRAAIRAPRLDQPVRYRDLTQQIWLAKLSDAAHTLNLTLSTETPRTIELITRLSFSVAASAHGVRLA